AYRKDAVRLLEIGIQNGGSLALWSRYFAYADKIIGCDINSACANLKYEDERIEIFVGDVNSDAINKRISASSKQFEVIIDDGSHASSDIVKSFARYFPAVSDGGVYVVEDLHCSYWQDCEGGLFDPLSSMSFFKALADVVNFEHWGIDLSPGDVLRGFMSEYNIEMSEYDLLQIHSIEFINSTCVVRKSAADNNVLGRRVIVGTEEDVVPGIVALLEGGSRLIPSQEENPWTNRAMTLAEELELKNKLVAKLSNELKGANEKVEALHGQIEATQNSLSWRISSPLRMFGKLFRGK
ncbi:MAG: CmcI family methyltransferase, partial [Sneathiella sp.]